jgi:hypothetical protein
VDGMEEDSGVFAFLYIWQFKTNVGDDKQQQQWQ